MTELQLTSPELKRLFDVIDLEPMPQSEALKRALDYWLTRRHGESVVSLDKIDPSDVPRFAPYLYLYEFTDDKLKDCRLIYRGAALQPVTGDHPAGAMLSQAGEAAFVEHALYLFALAAERGEPVCGTYHAIFDVAGELNVEILAAPLGEKAGGQQGIFGAVAIRHPEHGWEDHSVSVG